MSANVGENASPFVDQLADGPGVSRIDPTDPAALMYRLLALDALAGGVARPHAAAGAHRLYRAGEADRSC